jgi:hypothetical protein
VTSHEASRWERQHLGVPSAETAVAIIEEARSQRRTPFGLLRPECRLARPLARLAR